MVSECSGCHQDIEDCTCADDNERLENKFNRKCACGKNIVLSNDADPYVIGDREVCWDCFVKAVGKEFDYHPVMAPKKLHYNEKLNINYQRQKGNY